MSFYRGYESGHSRGGVDVTEAVNLAFKGILLSPVFILCIFITIAMLKHMIFGGIPTMNQPTEQQREQIQQRDAEIDPNTVWGGGSPTPSNSQGVAGGSPQPSVGATSTSPRSPREQEVPAPAPKQNTEVPFTIYEGPQDLPKYEQPLPPAEWNTQIDEDPLS